jgi:hypothetical protein
VQGVPGESPLMSPVQQTGVIYLYLDSQVFCS